MYLIGFHYLHTCTKGQDGFTMRHMHFVTVGIFAVNALPCSLVMVDALNMCHI